MTYRPKIYSGIIDALFITARDRNTSLTKLTNTYVHRALMTEYIPREAAQALSTRRNEMEADFLEAIQRSSTILPYGYVSRLSKNTSPFLHVTELTTWYATSIDGLARSLRLKESNQRATCKREPQELNIQWKYENLAVSLNQVYSDTLTALATRHQRCTATFK